MGKGPSCWFEQMKLANGDEFITDNRLNETKVLRNIERIISDIIGNRVDYNVYREWVLYPPVFNSLESYCADKLVVKQAELYALGYTINHINLGNIICNPTVNFDMYNTSDLDVETLSSMKPCITSSTRRNMSIAFQEINDEVIKYQCMCFYLSRVRVTGNVYELTNIPNALRGLGSRRR